MDVIKALYRQVFTLEAWLHLYDDSKTLQSTLIQPDDSDSYKDLIQTTIVGLSEPCTPNSNFSLSQNLHQREVVLRTIEKLIRRDGPGKNILTLGFNMLSDDANAQISSGANVEYRYPNNNVNKLHFKVWKQLLSRIGDSLMMYLLEKAAIFIFLAPSCYLQLAGAPIYNAWPYEVGKTFSIRQGEMKEKHKRKQTKSKAVIGKGAKNGGQSVIKRKMINDDRGTKRKGGYDNMDKIVEINRKRQRVVKNDFDETDGLKSENFEKLNRRQCDKVQKGFSPVEDLKQFQGSQGNKSPKSEVSEHIEDSLDTTASKILARKSEGQWRANSTTRVEAEAYSLKVDFQSEELNSDSISSSKRKRELVDYDLADIESTEAKRLKVEMDESLNELKADEDNLPDTSSKEKGLDHKIVEIDHGQLSNFGKGMEAKCTPTSAHKEIGRSDKARTDGIVTLSVSASRHTNGNSSRKRRKRKTAGLKVGVNETYGKALSLHERNNTSTTECHSEDDQPVETTRRENVWNFKAFDHLLYLPRTDILYSRNIRERFQKSATLAGLDVDIADAARFLYQKIFCETSVTTNQSSVEVTAPDTNNKGIAPDQAVPSLNRESERENVDTGLKTVNASSDEGGTCYPDRMERDQGIEINYVIHSEKNKSSQFETTKRSNNMLNKTVLRAHPSFIDSCELSQRTRNGSILPGNGIINNAEETGHPSFANSKYDFILSAGNLKEKSDIRHNCTTENLGKTKVDLLMARRQSILKNRSLSFSSSFDKMQGTEFPLTKVQASEVSSSSCRILEAMYSSDTSCCDSGLFKPENSSTTSLPECEVSNLEGKNDTKNANRGDPKSKYSTKDDLSMTNVEGKDVGNLTYNIQERAEKARTKGMNVGSVERHEIVTAEAENNSKADSETVKEKMQQINEKESLSLRIFMRTETLIKDGKTLKGDFQLVNVLTSDNVSLQGDNTLEEEGERNVKGGVKERVYVPVIAELQELLEEFVRRHRSCPYKVLLQHHCPLAWKQGRNSSSSRRKLVAKTTMARLLADHVHPRQVYLFLRVCFLKTFPSELFGSPHNRNIVLKNISQLISLGKFDKTCLGQLMVGLKTSEIPWLQNLHSNNLKLHLLGKLVYWTFKDYLFVLLKTYFYITETTFIKYRLIYYRQSVWNKLHIMALSGLLQKKIIRPVSENVAADWLQGDRFLGLCFLRFIPKQGSLRPIMNMSKVSTQLTSKKLSINKQLTDLLHILTYLKNKNPSVIGAGKFGMVDVYTAWSDYHKHWTKLGKPNLYFVKTDIVNCYDTILQKKLYSVLEHIFDEVEEEFVVRKYATVMVARGNLKRAFHRAASPLSEYEPDFIRVAKEMVSQNSMHDVILVDKVLHQHETKESLLQLLQTHLFHNIIKVGSKYFHQTCGISQGSVLSTLLCSVYYASMEQKYFQLAENDLLMRIVDDYLYVTPSKESAIRFLEQMLDGIPEYNCHVNAEKVLTNFEYIAEKFGKVTHAKEIFPWCGMLLNTRSLEVGVDYSRYIGHKISDSITFDLCHQPGLAMKKKILLSSRPKCHSIFMDPDINSEHQICVNCYQLFLLSAYKFHAYNRKLPSTQRAKNNPRFFWGVICDLSKYVYNQIGKQLKSVKVQDSSEKFCMENSCIKWLCLKAFQTVLHQQHSLYKDVLQMIRRDLQQLERRMVSSRLPPLNRDVLERLNKEFVEMFH